jgi:galactose mutarotase-like enzyme
VSFSHREEKRGDRLLDILTDEGGGSRITVSRLGAEMVSWQRRDAQGEWHGFLYRDNDLDAPEEGWANHATVMGYYLHRIKDQRTVYRGQVMEGGTHSFLRSKTWQLADVSAEEGRLTYRVTQDDYSEREYPLNVSLELTYQLAGDDLRVSFRFQNNEPELTAHLGFGLHPGFAATEFGSFELELPRGVYRRHFSPTNHLSGETEEITHEGGEMPFEKAKLSGSYILEFADVPERTFTFRDRPAAALLPSIWERSLRHSVVRRRPFLCIEPCWGLTDHEQQRAFEEKEGIQTIPAGGVLHAGFSMSARFNH